MRKEDYKNLGVKNGVEKGQKPVTGRREKFNVRNGIDSRPDTAKQTGTDHDGVLESGKAADLPKKKAGKPAVKIVLVIIIAFVVAAGIRIAAGPPILLADISAYENEKILISGLTEEDFYVTPAELARLPLTNVTAQGKSEKAGTVSGIGPTLDVFLEAYGDGATRDDFKQVKFYASDEYTTVLVKTLEEKEIVLSIANGREALEEWQQPLRIVIPEEDSGKWIRLVTEIEFTEKDDSQ